MFELREITDVFFYFRAYLAFLGAIAFIAAYYGKKSFLSKQALGVQALVVVLAFFNIVILGKQLGLRIFWDVSILIIGIVFFIKMVRWENGAKANGSLLYIKPFLLPSFWIFSIPYILFFPSMFKPLE